MTWAGVIGSPIEHSLSPVLHTAAWRFLGLGSDWTYRRILCDEAGVPALLSSLDGSCRGLSVTMPCKQAVIPLLDAIDPLAEAVFSVNTVIPSGGVLTGFNTDVSGIQRAIERKLPGSASPQRAVILGAGATAASALAAAGSLGITDLHVVARRFSGPHSIVRVAHNLGVTIKQHLWSDLAGTLDLLASADIVISTMPSGVCDDLAQAINAAYAADDFNCQGKILLDVVYSPLTTALVNSWRSANGLVAHGLFMLAFQAVQQVKLMTGHDVPEDVVLEAVCAELGLSLADLDGDQ